jgi:glycosyltransferase involved in cell wall biosynthesis
MISAIIPARNEEASIARAVESVAAQPEVEEVIVVDDESTDGTCDLLIELAEEVPKLKIVINVGLPAGWTGKNYAASVGAAEARGEWLLFTDADTYHYPGAARRALQDAVDREAVLVSYSPEQDMETWWERALIPFVFCRLAAKFSYRRVNNPSLPDAAANGQFILILREVYQAVGGHAAVKGEVLEDVALAKRVKEAWHKIYFAAPMGVVQTRMYRSLGAMWEGWTKNLYKLLGGNATGAILEIVRVLAEPLAAVLLILWGVTHGGAPVYFALAGMVILIWHLAYAAELGRNRFPVRFIVYMSGGVCLYAGVLGASWWKNTRGRVVWKGREYRARA